MSLENLFRSKVLYRILKLLIDGNARSLFVREIARKISADPGAVQRELKNLEDDGLVIAKMEGKNKYYSIKKDNPFVSPLRQIFRADGSFLPKKFIVAYEEPLISPLTLSTNTNGWPALRKDKRFLKQDVGDSAVVYYDDNFKFAIDMEKMTKAGEEVNRSIQGKDYALKNREEMEKLGKKILKTLRWMARETETGTNFSKKLESIFDMGIELCQIGYIGPLTDFPKPFLSNKMKEIATERLRNSRVKMTPQQVINILNAPTELSLNGERERVLLKIAEKILRKKRKKEGYGQILEEEIKNYYFDFYWTNFGHYGFEKDPKTGIQEIEDVLRNYNIRGIKDRIKELENYSRDTEKKKIHLFKELGLTEKEINIFRSAGVLAYLKGLRQELLSGINSQIRVFLEELEHRYGVRKEDLWRASFDEVLEIFRNGPTEGKTLELKNRKNLSVWVIGSKIRDQKMLNGEEAEEFIREHIIEKEEKIDNKKSFHGMTAYPGRVCGKAVIINSINDLERVEEGSVLIAQQTMPEMLPAMKRASAFITNIGGITCHAAIMAREFKKPCIVGTKVATKIVKDGDTVEVDADKGTVRIMRLNIK